MGIKHNGLHKYPTMRHSNRRDLIEQLWEYESQNMSMTELLDLAKHDYMIQMDYQTDEELETRYRGIFMLPEGY